MTFVNSSRIHLLTSLQFAVIIPFHRGSSYHPKPSALNKGYFNR